MTFNCLNGIQKSDRAVFLFASKFFTRQLKGRDGMGNPPVFNYKCSHKTIKFFLDLMHGIDADSMDLLSLLELMKFLRYEAKSGKLLTLGNNLYY